MYLGVIVSQKICSKTSPKPSFPTDILPKNNIPVTIRRYIPTGGTIVGKTTPNGGYIAGALTKQEQEDLVSKAINQQKGNNVKIETVGHIDAGGSQNITEKDIGNLVKILNKEMKSDPSKGGILITAGTDKISMLTHTLNMLIPSPAVPIVLTAAMCPPGGTEKGLCEYEDGPVNLRSSENLLRTLEKGKQNVILSVMEDKAFAGENMSKALPKGVRGAFQPRIGQAAYKLVQQEKKTDFYSESGDPDKYKWTQIKFLPKTDAGNQEFKKYQDKILKAMTSPGGLETSIVTDSGQSSLAQDLRAISQHDLVIGYKGVGNGNINERDTLETIEDIILSGKGHSFVRGTEADGKAIKNEKSEASNVPIFEDIAKDANYKLTDFMISQDRFRTGQASQIVGMVNAMGITPPKKCAHQHLLKTIWKAIRDMFKKYPILYAVHTLL